MDREPVISLRQLQYLEAMGIQAWVRRTGETSARELIAGSDGVRATGLESGSEGSGWEVLQAQVSGCTQCGLHKSRTRTVFGTGSHSARWLIVGEAPGAEEDRQGVPFVGRAGKLLDAMLCAAGLRRDEVFIANILKCRPPANRDPRPDEVASCRPYLERQIAMIKPRIILAVGRIAAQNLLETDAPLGALREKKHIYSTARIPVVVTYHPAYLLRSPLAKRKAWMDLQFACRVSMLREETSTP